MIRRNWVRGFTSLFAVLAILTTTSSFALAFSKTNGEIIVKGNSVGNGSYVLLNGEKAYNGRTFISSGVIKTEDTEAIVKVNGLGLVKLAPKTTLDLTIADGSISGVLSNGKVKVFNKKGVTSKIETKDSKVSSDGTEKNIFDVSVAEGNTVANSEKGSIFVNSGETTTVVAQDDDDDDDDGLNILPLVITFAGIVSVAAWLALSSGDDEELNVVSATF